MKLRYNFNLEQRPTRILVVNEKPILRESIANHLRKNNFEVESCKYKATSQNLIFQLRPEIILFSIDVGPAKASRLTSRARVTLDKIRFIGTTEERFLEDNTLCEALGLSGILTMPYSFNDIMRTIEQNTSSHSEQYLNRMYNYGDSNSAIEEAY